MVTREEVIFLMGTLQAAYPKFYTNMTKRQIETTVDLWTVTLSDIEVSRAAEAVMEIIKTSKWPPTIAEIRVKAAEAEKRERFDKLNRIKEIQMTVDTADSDTFKRIMDKDKADNGRVKWRIGNTETGKR